MEEAIRAGEQNIVKMKEILGGASEVDVSAFEKNMEVLQQTLLQMSKVCLTELSKCNEQFCEMEQRLAADECSLSVIRDTRGHGLLKSGKECQEGARIPTANVKTQELPKIDIPKAGSYDLTASMRVLNGIGRAAGDTKDLIKKYNIDQEVGWPWSCQSDFFIIRKTGKPTTFSQTYGVASPSVE